MATVFFFRTLLKFCPGEAFEETRNKFYGTSYLTHCCALFCSNTFFL